MRQNRFESAPVRASATLAFLGLAAAGCSAPATLAGHAAGPRASHASPAERAGGNPASVAISIGQMDMDDDQAWAGIDEPARVGLQSWFGLDEKGLVGIETGFGIAADNTEVMGVDVDARMIDVTLGLRLSFPLGNTDGVHVVPYVSGGGLIALADVTGEFGGFTVSDDDNTFGHYFQMGLGVPLNDSVELGVKYRVVGGTDVELGGVESDVDHELVAFYVGVRL